MQRLSYSPLSLLLVVLMGPLQLAAGVHSGSVRAADHFIPGATVTARQGTVKLLAYTDESGQYSLVLTPGHWDISVEILGFTTQTIRILGDEDTAHEWAMEMPRIGDPTPPAAGAAPPPPPSTATTTEAANPAATQTSATAPASPTAPTPVAASTPAKTAAEQPKVASTGTGSSQGRNRNGRSGQQARPGFQNASVKATDEGQQALSQAAAAPSSIAAGGEAEETMMVQGSTSGGLAAASDDESRRQRFNSTRGGGGEGNPSLFASGMGESGGGLGLPPGMNNGSGDSLGLGGFGASAIAGGFGADSGPMPGMDGGRGGRGGGPPGGGGGGGDRGGGRGGPSGRRGRPGGDHRGPYNGQYASFGNRHRTGAELTGSAFIYLNNSYLNAAPFSLNGQTAAKPSYDQARFGINIGGPLIIPKLLNLPRWSFYFTYSGSRSRNPYNAVSSLPTPAERAGDFSGISSTVYDPLSKTPFAGNLIPSSRISPIAQGLLQYFPLPTYTTGIQNYRLVNSIPNNNGNYGVRLNAPLSTKDRLTFNVQTQGRDSESETLFGYHDTSTGTGLSASVGWSHSFAPRFNNSATVSLSRNISKASPFFAYTQNIAGILGITGTAQDPIDYGPPSLSFTNFGGLSDGTASVNRSQSISFTDGITYVIKRRHNLTFGYSFRKMQQNSLAYPNGRGSFTFSGLLTSQVSATGQPSPGTGFDFADFLLGLPQSSSVRYGTIANGVTSTSSNNYFRGWSTSGYAQDDWRLSKRLSFNIGIRYEYFSPYTELFGHLANLDVSPAINEAAVVTPGQKAPFSGDVPTSLVRPDDHNFSPRFGFAYRVAKKRSTVIRGGYSTFYSGSAYNQIASQMASQPPFARTVTVTTSDANKLTLQNGFTPLPSQTINNTFAIDPDYRLSYAQQWVAAVQDTFHRDLVVELEYIGTKGTHLGVVDQPNRAAPGASLVNAQTLLPIANATTFNYQTSGANSSFNAGQIRMTRRFNRGISTVALYTFSKSIDDASSFSGPGGTTVQFINNLALERGLSTFDQRHRLSLTFLLSSPVGVHGMLRNGGWKTTALTGWLLSGTYGISSGTPLTARVAGNLSNTGGTAAYGTGRAEATGQSINAGNYPYFNLLAFTTPPPGMYGNAGRDTIPGPIVPTFNLSLNRSFRLGESRRQLQLRLSANNALNHVVITGYGATINAATYGLPTAASGTRTVTLMLRFSF